MLTVSNLAQAISQTVIERGFTAYTNPEQRSRKLCPVARDVLAKCSDAIKSHKKDVVVFVDGSNEAFNGLSGCTNLVAFHTAAGIQDDANTDRQIVILCEMRDLLRNAVFFDGEV